MANLCVLFPFFWNLKCEKISVLIPLSFPFFATFHSSSCPLPPSQRGQEPGSHGPQRSVRPLREAEAGPGPSQREQAEDQDHQVLPQPHLERDL